MYAMKDAGNQIRVELNCLHVRSDIADVYTEQFKDLDAAKNALGDLYCELCPDYDFIPDQRRGPVLVLFGTTAIMDLNYRAITVKISEMGKDGNVCYELSDLEVSEICRAGYNLGVDEDEDDEDGADD